MNFIKKNKNKKTNNGQEVEIYYNNLIFLPEYSIQTLRNNVKRNIIIRIWSLAVYVFSKILGVNL